MIVATLILLAVVILLGAGCSSSTAGDMVGLNLPPPASVQNYNGLIATYSEKNHLDSELVTAVIEMESGGDAKAVSPQGAMGLMQLMPGTAEDLGVQDPYDPEENIAGGTLYLRRMLDHFDQDLSLALAAYNAGPGAVEKYGGIPPYPETSRYVDGVLSLYHAYKSLNESSPATTPSGTSASTTDR